MARYTKTLESYEPHRINPRRTSMFRATATSSDGMHWKIRMIADYAPSADLTIDEKDPIPVMQDLYQKWIG